MRQRRGRAWITCIAPRPKVDKAEPRINCTLCLRNPLLEAEMVTTEQMLREDEIFG